MTCDYNCPICYGDLAYQQLQISDDTHKYMEIRFKCKWYNELMIMLS